MFKTIDNLKNSRNIIMDILSKYHNLGEIWFPNDIFVVSIMTRVNAINEAFVELTSDIEDSGVAAFPLIRMQLDNLLYFYAGTTVDDFMELMGCFVNGDNWNRFKDKEGNELKESYLIDKLCEKFDTDIIRLIYKKASNYIHLSTDHIAITLNKYGDEAVKSTVGNYEASDHKEGLINMMLFINGAILKIFTTDYSFLRYKSHKELEKMRLEHPTLSDMEILEKYGYSNEKLNNKFYNRLRIKE